MFRRIFMKRLGFLPAFFLVLGALATLSCSDSRHLFGPLDPSLALLGFSVSGEVTDQSGDPLPDAVVEALDPTSGVVAASATSDSEGQYLLTLVAETYNFRVTPPAGSEYQIATLSDQVIEADAVINFVLIPANAITLTGQVLDGEGEGMPGQQVEILPFGGGPSLYSITDMTGTCSFTLASGNYDIRLRWDVQPDAAVAAPRNYYLRSHWDQPLVLSGDTELDFALPLNRVDVLVQDPAGNRFRV